MPAEQGPLLTSLCITENRPAFLPWLLWNYDKQTWANRKLVIVDRSHAPYRSDRPDVRVIAAPPGTGVASMSNLALPLRQAADLPIASFTIDRNSKSPAVSQPRSMESWWKGKRRT
jgi:hypothetical protein